ncbi:MAG: hypothetical protein WA987_07185 [Cellvibrio sp.]
MQHKKPEHLDAISLNRKSNPLIAGKWHIKAAAGARSIHQRPRELSAMADISVEGWVGLGSGGANATCGWGIGMSDYAALIRPTDVGGVAGVSDYALRANPTYGGEF